MPARFQFNAVYECGSSKLTLIMMTIMIELIDAGGREWERVKPNECCVASQLSLNATAIIFVVVQLFVLA